MSSGLAEVLYGTELIERLGQFTFKQGCNGGKGAISTLIGTRRPAGEQLTNLSHLQLCARIYPILQQQNKCIL